MKILYLSVAVLIGFLSPVSGLMAQNSVQKGWQSIGGSEITGYGIVHSPNHTELVIAVDPETKIVDYSRKNPNRIVFELLGASIPKTMTRYDGALRGGVFDVKIEYSPETGVRFILEVAHDYRYSVVREKHVVRIRLITGLQPFSPWFSSAHARMLAGIAANGEESSDLVDKDSLNHVGNAGRAVGSNQSGAGLSSGSASEKRRITVAYNDADIRDVIAAFATFAKRTIVAGKEVAGLISAEIKNQPWDLALKALLQGHGFTVIEDKASGILTVDSYANMHARQSLEPLVTQMVPINYAKADSLAKVVEQLLVKDCYGQTESSVNNLASNCLVRGAVGANTSTNTIIVTETPSRIDQIIRYIKSLDVRSPQVAIKAKIIFVNRTEIENLGISYDIGTPTHYMSKLIPRTPAGGTVSAGDKILLGGNTLAAIANASSRVPSAALSLVYSTAIGKYSVTGFLDALQEVRLADLQAEPSIVTVDNREATIQVGQDVPVRVLDANTATGMDGSGTAVPRATVSFRPVGIILKVTPHITNNGHVLLDVHAENSDAQIASSDVGYVFNKQSAMNRLIVKDGETAVIGGLTVTQVSESFTGIPVLSKLPLIGKLFRSSAKQKEKRDLLILITPYIVDEGEKVVGGSNLQS